MNAIKIICTLSLVMHISMIQATWIIVKIDNQSDLVFSQAVRSNGVEIASISQVLKKSQDNKNNIVYLDSDAFFGSSGGCKIIAKAPTGNLVTIAFFDDPRHRVANGRVRNADIDSRNAAALIKDPMIARIFILQDGIQKLIGFTGYENENQNVALTLTGSQGNYQARLVLQ